MKDFSMNSPQRLRDSLQAYNGHTRVEKLAPDKIDSDPEFQLKVTKKKKQTHNKKGMRDA